MITMLTIMLLSTAAETNSDAAAFQSWRRQREASLRQSDGYLALTALLWLKDGTGTIGSNADNDYVLPNGRGPARAGEIHHANGKVTFRSHPGVNVSSNGNPVVNAVMHSDADGRRPTKFSVDELTFWVIERSGRRAVRLSDPQSPILMAYESTPFYSFDPGWCIDAVFEPPTQQAKLSVPSIIGTSSEVAQVGRFVFMHRGKTQELYPTSRSENEMFLIFGDRTNGKDTYGAGRFLKVELGPDGKSAVLDFNRAYNPPCAYNPHTTCPMPPRENRLPFRVEAGERAVKATDH